MHCHETILILVPLQKRNSVTQRKLYWLLSRRSSCLAISRRRFPSTSHTTLFLSAAKMQKIPRLSIHSLNESRQLLFCHKFRKRRFHTSILSNRKVGKPFAPYSFAKSTSLSIFLRGIAPCPLALIPLTLPP